MRDLVDMAEFDQSVRQETERPAAPTRWRAPARQSDQVGLLLAVEHSRTARQGPTNESPLQAAFDERAADPVDSDRSEVQSVADLLVRPCRTKAAAIGLQEDARPGQLARRRLAFGDERFQQAAFLDRQPHDEPFVHDRTPSHDPGQALQDWTKVRGTYQYQVDEALADALYCDGPLLAWLAYQKGIDVLTVLPPDRQMHADVLGMARRGLLSWTQHRYVRTIRGQKQMRTVEVAAVGDLTSWDSFVGAARGYGEPDARLWACVIREVAPTEQAWEDVQVLVSTRRWANGFAALQGFRPRWHIENDAYRELKEGFGLEQQRWGRDAAAALCRTTLTILAFNTAQVYRTGGGAKLARQGIRRLRQQSRRQLGPSPAVIFYDDCYAVLSLEEVLEALWADVRHGLLPKIAPKNQAAHPS
jgi:hypothetical protein